MAPRVVSHTHQAGGPVCTHRTVAACDKAHAEWAAMQQVLLAYKIAMRRENLRPWKKDGGIFAQLVLVIAGEQAAIMTKDGHPSQSHEVKRLMAAIERVKAGDLPRYTLYRLPVGSDNTGEQ